MKVYVTNNTPGPRGLTNGGVHFKFQSGQTLPMTPDELKVLKAHKLINQYFRTGEFSEKSGAPAPKAEVKPVEAKPVEAKKPSGKKSSKKDEF